ncbi:MAG: hypothetical protein HKN37_12120 [Rhodothermales bacterium]|nr:hypothetical protein [Rhodothermales bacterium]
MPRHLIRVALVLALLIPASPGLVTAQDMRTARRDHLASLGSVESASAVESYLLRQLQTIGAPNAGDLAEFFSFVMVIHGLDLQKLERLQAGGIDLVHAMTSDARPFMEQGLFSDPVVVAEVVDFGDSDEPTDGYRSTIAVRVVETLKGEVSADTLFLRQRGQFRNGMGQNEFAPRIGEKYLLLLSRPMYEFFASRRQAPTQASAVPRHAYAIYRYYRADDNRIVMGDGSSHDAGSIYQELRWLEELMEAL